MPSPGNDGWGPSRIVPPLTSKKQVPSTAALETHLKVMAIHEELPDFDPVEDGALELFLDVLPLELILEVFQWLYPFDLLNLMDSSRFCESILRSRHAVKIWRISRLNVGADLKLPSCPSHLSEVEYTKVLFDVHCHFCAGKTEHSGSNRPCYLDAARFIRMCHWCFEENYTDLEEYIEHTDIAEDIELDWDNPDGELAGFLSRVLLVWTSDTKTIYLKSDLDKALPMFLDMREENNLLALEGYVARRENLLFARQSFRKVCESWQPPSQQYGYPWNEWGERSAIEDIPFFLVGHRLKRLRDELIARGLSDVYFDNFIFDELNQPDGPLRMFSSIFENPPLLEGVLDFFIDRDRQVKAEAAQVRNERARAKEMAWQEWKRQDEELRKKRPKKRWEIAMEQLDSQSAMKVWMKKVLAVDGRGKKFLCEHCNNLNGKVFDIPGLHSHLQHKHNIANPGFADYCVR